MTYAHRFHLRSIISIYLPLLLFSGHTARVQYSSHQELKIDASAVRFLCMLISCSSASFFLSRLSLSPLCDCCSLRLILLSFIYNVLSILYLNIYKFIFTEKAATTTTTSDETPSPVLHVQVINMIYPITLEILVTIFSRHGQGKVKERKNTSEITGWVLAFHLPPPDIDFHPLRLSIVLKVITFTKGGVFQALLQMSDVQTGEFSKK